jgi:hypothetical protein
MISRKSVPFHVSSSLSGAMAALDGFLEDAGYHAYSRRAIVRAAAVHGTPTASTELCDEDEAEATEAWVSALPESPFDGPAWDHEDVFLDVELLAAGTHPFPMPEPPDGPDAPDDGPSVRFPGISLPPIRGGSDEAEPFVPSAEDLADYHAWSEDLDRRRNAGDRHSPDALARLHRALYGRTEPFHA